jgi:hypothetical protein
MIPLLDVKGGIILETENNYRLISTLDSIYVKYYKLTSKKVLTEVMGTFESIRSDDYDFMTINLSPELIAKFKDIKKEVIRITDLRFGLKGGKFYAGGFLDNVLKENSPTALKRLLSKMVSAQVNTSDFIKYLRAYFRGKEGYEAKFTWFAFDVYQQYDATYNATLADKLGLTNFIYQGGLIEDSRDFCAAHDGKVWTTKEAEEWENWRPIDGIKDDMYPEGYEVKAKDLYSVPSYLGYPGYNPLYDRGGFRCRHQLSYISDELAKRLRPVKNNNEES